VDISVNLFEAITANDHEQVIVFQNRASGLRGFLAIHDTTLGPALGGVRIKRYASDEEALADALRLSCAMSYKAALAELPAGGGKTVLPLPASDNDWNRAEAMEALGTMIQSFGGRYYCGTDVGITRDDLAAIGRATQYVADESLPALGDISEHTAIGVWHALRASLEFTGLCKPRVAIQGVGNVGMWLARILHREGFSLVIADVDANRTAQAARELGAEVISPDEILSIDCTVLAPCALGGVISAESAARVRAQIVCGSANNILASPEAGDVLARRGIWYVPDYLANAGGLIRGAEYYLLKRADSRPSLERIYDRTKLVLERAKQTGVATARIADEMATARLKRPKHFRDLHWAAFSQAGKATKS
jgi:leucine dehydrogenase